MTIKLSVQKATTDSVSLAVKLNSETKNYSAKIINDRGLFGVEFPAELNLLLQQFPAETKQLVGEIRKRFVRETQLQAA